MNKFDIVINAIITALVLGVVIWTTTIPWWLIAVWLGVQIYSLYRAWENIDL